MKNSSNLELVEADLLKKGSFDLAVKDCEGVFHVASPFHFKYQDPQKDLIDPAVNGTLNVLEACSKESSVRRVVLTSSAAAIYGAPLSQSETFDESNWNTKSTIETSPYPLSKVLAEKAAWEFCEKQQRLFDLIVINPPLIIGPVLKPKSEEDLNTSSEMILKYLNGSNKNVANGGLGFVDVRDVAKAHILAMETPQAKGRYICAFGSFTWKHFCETLRKLFPGYPIATEGGNDVAPYFKTDKIRKELAMEFIPIEQTLKDLVESLVQNGWIEKKD